MKLDFPVTICLGGGDGGDVSVIIDVNEEEFDLLVKNCSEGIDLADSDELADLYYQILDMATDEDEVDEAAFLVGYPEKVIDKVEE